MNVTLLKYVLIFFAIICIVYLPCAHLWIWRRNKIGKKFEQEHNAVKFYVKRTKMNDLLNVYRINGEKPVVHRTWRRYGFYLLPGKNTLEIQYQWFRWNFFRALMPMTNPMATHTESYKKITVTVEPNKIYVLYFDHNKKDYVFAEEKSAQIR